MPPKRVDVFCGILHEQQNSLLVGCWENSKEEIKMNWLITKIKGFLADEDGVTAIEYGLIAAFIAVVIILAVTGVGDALVDIFTEIASALQ
jgi:pilus assembly protein Flp/PilA